MSELSVEAAYVSRLSARNFRTYHSIDIELSPGLTIATGSNGAGKTNLLEAIAFGCSGASPRTASELDCISENTDICRIDIEAHVGDQHVRRHRLTLAHGYGKRLTLDDKSSNVTDYALDVPIVTFLPERLLAVRGAPARRRQLLDTFVSRLTPAFQRATRDYTHALSQRNSLVRRARNRDVDPAEVEPWNAALTSHGAALRSMRDNALEALLPWYRDRVEMLTGFSKADIVIDPRGEDLAQSLSESWSVDVRRGSTTVGPHLDDVTLHMDGREMRRRGSTGEQRASLLAWCLATHDSLVASIGVAPVVILDEPWSELDRSRRIALTRTIGMLSQAITSTTEPPDLTGVTARVLAVSSGAVAPCTTTN